MINSIFLMESDRERHRAAPLLTERERYLSYLREIGTRRERIRDVASMLLHVIRLLDLASSRPVEMAEISQGDGAAGDLIHDPLFLEADAADRRESIMQQMEAYEDSALPCGFYEPVIKDGEHFYRADQYKVWQHRPHTRCSPVALISAR